MKRRFLAKPIGAFCRFYRRIISGLNNNAYTHTYTWHLNLLNCVIFLIFWHPENSCKLLNITFIFDRWRRSSAAVTHAKYERYAKNRARSFAKSTFFLTENLADGAIGNPAPELRGPFISCTEIESFSLDKRVAWYIMFGCVRPLTVNHLGYITIAIQVQEIGRSRYDTDKNTDCGR